jgi:hypothetical protein
VIDARGRIVMPGSPTHHHLFETALRSFWRRHLINDGSNTRAGNTTSLRIHPADLLAGVPPAGCVHQRAVRLLSQLDAATTVHAFADPSLAA